MKVLKWILIVIVALIVLGFAGFQFMKYQTKKVSPEETVTYESDDITLEVNYSRPYKKGREIFGGLVPFGEVWRTGANEPTTFLCSKDISIGVNEERLKAGKYTVWTIPNKTQWTLIFNSKMYGWGVGMDGKPSRDPLFDVVRINLPAMPTKEPVEQFTIEFIYNVNMVMKWDDTKVTMPILTY
jgi:hypothetical protein